MSQTLLNIARRCCHWLEIKNKTFLSSLRPPRRKEWTWRIHGTKCTFHWIFYSTLDSSNQDPFLSMGFWVCDWVYLSYFIMFIWQMRITYKWYNYSVFKRVNCSGSFCHCPPFSKLLCCFFSHRTSRNFWRIFTKFLLLFMTVFRLKS